MRLLAAEIQTEHIGLMLSIAAMACTVVLGVLQLQSRRQTNANTERLAMAQTPECKYQHEGLQSSVNRLEVSQEKILTTQREITQVLDRVANTLDRVSEKLDGDHHLRNGQ